MDKLENWVTWALMFALLYEIKQAGPQQVCATTTTSPWGVVSALQQNATQQATLAGFCGGNCGPGCCQ